MQAKKQVERLAAAPPEERTVIWHVDQSLSEIYLTVKAKMCSWFKATRTDPVPLYTNEMLWAEMDCSAFTEAHRNYFSLCHVFFSSIAEAYMNSLFWRFFKNLEPVASWSAAWKVVTPHKPTENIGKLKQGKCHFKETISLDLSVFF